MVEAQKLPNRMLLIQKIGEYGSELIKKRPIY